MSNGKPGSRLQKGQRYGDAIACQHEGPSGSVVQPESRKILRVLVGRRVCMLRTPTREGNPFDAPAFGELDAVLRRGGAGNGSNSYPGL